MQLHHTLHAQFTSSPVWFPLVPVLQRVVQATSTKCLISVTFLSLLESTFHKCHLPSRAKWEQDIGPIPNNAWEESLWVVPFVSLLPLHRLTQFFILHKVYGTLEFMCAIGLRTDPACPRCGNLGSLIHLLWHCTNLQVLGRGCGYTQWDLRCEPSSGSSYMFTGLC